MFLGSPRPARRIIDVWESKQAWERLRTERLAPAVAALGGPARHEPTFRDLHAAHVVVSDPLSHPEGSTKGSIPTAR